MPVRLPRVEAILGAPIDQLTYEHIQAAVEAGVEESADLDFKERHYEDTEQKREELAKDVAAFANHVGGLLVIGVREEHLRAAEVTPVPLAGDPASRYRQILAGRVTPHVRDVSISVLKDSAELHLGVVLIAVPRSLLAPHAVFREYDKRRQMSWPVRSGSDTRFLDETELADFYRTRFAGVAAQTARLDRVQAEGRLRLGGAPVWLSVSLVPAFPGEVWPTDRVARATNLTRRWALEQPWREQNVPAALARPVRATVGVRRAILPQGRNWQADRLHVELHDDGAGYAAVVCGAYSDDSAYIGVPLRELALDTLWLTSLLVDHARDSGASGETLFGAELITHPNREIQIQDDDGFGPPEDPAPGGFKLNTAVLPDSTRPATTSLSVDLSALAPGVRPIARVAAQLAGDLVAIFGVADLDILTPVGQLRLVTPLRPPGGWPELGQWVKRNGLGVGGAGPEVHSQD